LRFEWSIVLYLQQKPMIDRILSQTMARFNTPRKAIMVVGPRQVGKTTLLKSLYPEALWFDGDEPDDRAFLTNPTSTLLTSRIGQNQVVVIDEAQRVQNIGVTLKLITDKLPGVQLYVSGSSSFDLGNQLNEPLTGRKWDFNLLPVSFAEMKSHHGLTTELRLLEQRLVYGYYPEVVTHPQQAEQLVKQLTTNYLFKDILSWERIQKPDRLEKLVQALAFQVGQLVSYNELSKIVGLRHETVESYIQILEKAFVVFRVGSLARNLRNELTKSRKIFFYDNGIRNAVINQFSSWGLRADTGALWENFLMAERKKYLNNLAINVNGYFWRTKEKAEIDYIEERDGKMDAREFKLSPKTDFRVPPSFAEAYKPATVSVVNRDNFWEWIS